MKTYFLQMTVLTLALLGSSKSFAVRTAETAESTLINSVITIVPLSDNLPASGTKGAVGANRAASRLEKRNVMTFVSPEGARFNFRPLSTLVSGLYQFIVRTTVNADGSTSISYRLNTVRPSSAPASQVRCFPFARNDLVTVAYKRLSDRTMAIAYDYYNQVAMVPLNISGTQTPVGEFRLLSGETLTTCGQE